MKQRNLHPHATSSVTSNLEAACLNRILSHPPAAKKEARGAVGRTQGYQNKGHASGDPGCRQLIDHASPGATGGDAPQRSCTQPTSTDILSTANLKFISSRLLNHCVQIMLRFVPHKGRPSFCCLLPLPGNRGQKDGVEYLNGSE